MSKCLACGKFLSATDGVKCTKCASIHHRLCVNLSQEVGVPDDWTCPGCVAKAPRRDNTNTPVRGCETGQERAVPKASGRDPARVKTNEPAGPSNAVATKAPARDQVAEQLRLFRKEFAGMRDELAGVRQDMAELQKVVSGYHSRLETVEDRVKRLEERFTVATELGPNAELANTVAELKLELADRDQDLLLNDLEITGIPEAPNENQIHIVSLVARKLGVTLDRHDVVFAERVGARREPPHELQGGPVNNIGPPRSEDAEAGQSEESACTQVPTVIGVTGTRPRPLIVRLTRRGTRNELLRAARVRRGADTSDFGLPGRPARFYINERLTRTNRSLFYSVRQECKAQDWRYPWTRDGRIYVRRHKDAPPRRIRTMTDFNQVFGTDTV